MDPDPDPVRFFANLRIRNFKIVLGKKCKGGNEKEENSLTGQNALRSHLSGFKPQPFCVRLEKNCFKGWEGMK